LNGDGYSLTRVLGREHREVLTDQLGAVHQAQVECFALLALSVLGAESLHDPYEARAGGAKQILAALFQGVADVHQLLAGLHAGDVGHVLGAH